VGGSPSPSSPSSSIASRQIDISRQPAALTLSSSRVAPGVPCAQSNGAAAASPVGGDAAGGALPREKQILVSRVVRPLPPTRPLGH